jgi:hypothetical protein
MIFLHCIVVISAVLGSYSCDSLLVSVRYVTKPYCPAKNFIGMETPRRLGRIYTRHSCVCPLSGVFPRSDDRWQSRYKGCSLDWTDLVLDRNWTRGLYPLQYLVVAYWAQYSAGRLMFYTGLKRVVLCQLADPERRKYFFNNLIEEDWTCPVSDMQHARP